MLQPLHPYGVVLNLDVIDFRNIEKSGVAVEVAARMFFAKICSPWREMLIQSYKVPEGQMDSVARIMSFLKDKLKDWCYQASIQKNMKRLRDCPQKRGVLRKFEATKDILDAVYYGDLVPIYQFEDLPSDESAMKRRQKLIRIDLHPSQNNYNEGDRLQTSESLSGFFSRMTNWRDRKVLNQIGLNQRKHHIIYKVSSGEFAIPMEFTGTVMEMQLIPKEEILEELSRLREEIAVTMKWIHIGTIEVVIKATFKEGIDSEIHLSIMDRRINNLRDGCLGTMIDNLPYSITYGIAYALSNTHHSDLFLRKEYIEIPRIFKEFAKVMAPDPIRIPRIRGIDIVIKDHPVLDRTISSRTEFSSRMSFSEDRNMGYKGKEKDLLKALTPQEIRVDNVKLRCPEGWKEIQAIFDITKNENFFPCDDLYHLQQPVVGRYEGMLEIASYEILVAGVAGRENGSMTLGLSFLEDHKPWGRKGNGMEFSIDGVTIRIE
ncbi:movement protein [Sesamum angolense]|uniref:Movement protein n=1 Tax=Sesamum angolense TaxID=2727404 RepID=A0AAE1WZ86_9LAMI|nr:movement protein [Sesamum angolense]